VSAAAARDLVVRLVPVRPALVVVRRLVPVLPVPLVRRVVPRPPPLVRSAIAGPLLFSGDQRLLPAEGRLERGGGRT
jgi:hypothetical protein